MSEVNVSSKPKPVSPDGSQRNDLCTQLTITLELNEEFLKQVIAIGGVEAWNDLHRRLDSVCAQVWSEGADAPALMVFFNMPGLVKKQFPEADMRYVWFNDEDEDEPKLPAHATIKAVPTITIPIDGSTLELTHSVNTISSE